MTNPTTGEVEGTISPSELRAQNEAAAAKATRQAEEANEADKADADSKQLTKTLRLKKRQKTLINGGGLNM